MSDSSSSSSSDEDGAHGGAGSGGERVRWRSALTSFTESDFVNACRDPTARANHFTANDGNGFDINTSPIVINEFMRSKLWTEVMANGASGFFNGKKGSDGAQYLGTGTDGLSGQQIQNRETLIFFVTMIFDDATRECFRQLLDSGCNAERDNAYTTAVRSDWPDASSNLSAVQAKVTACIMGLYASLSEAVAIPDVDVVAAVTFQTSNATTAGNFQNRAALTKLLSLARLQCASRSQGIAVSEAEVTTQAIALLFSILDSHERKSVRELSQNLRAEVSAAKSDDATFTWESHVMPMIVTALQVNAKFSGRILEESTSGASAYGSISTEIEADATEPFSKRLKMGDVRDGEIRVGQQHQQQSFTLDQQSQQCPSAVPFAAPRPLSQQQTQLFAHLQQRKVELDAREAAQELAQQQFTQQQQQVGQLSQSSSLAGQLSQSIASAGAADPAGSGQLSQSIASAGAADPAGSSLAGHLSQVNYQLSQVNQRLLLMTSRLEQQYQQIVNMEHARAREKMASEAQLAQTNWTQLKQHAVNQESQIARLLQEATTVREQQNLQQLLASQRDVAMILEEEEGKGRW
jgi:hypothetical protein